MTRLRVGVVVAVGVVVSLALAFFVSPEADSQPDGLNRVAMDAGFADQEEAHRLEDGPLAGYGVEGVDDDRLGTGLAAVAGVAVTFAAGAGLLLVVRRLRRGGVR